MIRIFIGTDSNEQVAHSVLAHSLVHTAKEPLSITYLVLDQLPLLRPIDANQSTEFAFSRFLVPYLCGYQGMSVFMDCDFLCREDIAGLLRSVDKSKAVSVVKHAYTPKSEDKFLLHKQTSYERKNWSSLMVFNNALCAHLTPALVDKVPGLYLHQFKWLEESQIGSIDRSWNHLVDEENQCHIDEARMLHFTRGTPGFRKYANCPGASEWHQVKDGMLWYNRYGEALERRTGT